MKKTLLKITFLIVSILMIISFTFMGCKAEEAQVSEETGETSTEETEESVVEEVSETTEEEITEEETAEEATAESGLVTVNMITGGVTAHLELEKRLAAAYMEEHPNVVVNVIDSAIYPQDLLSVYLQYMNAESPDIDIYRIDVIWPGDLAEHFLDLNDYGLAEMASEHFPAIIENNTVDGKFVAMPLYTDAGLFYYRTDLLDKYGCDVPKTWDELEEVTSTIQEGERTEGNADFVGFLWDGYAYEGLTCFGLEVIASSEGGTIISPEKVITINNDNAIAAVNKAASWIGTISPEGTTSYQCEDIRAIWQGGNAAFMRNWPYCYSLGQGEDSAIAGKFDITTLPSIDGENSAATLGGWQMALSKYSENPEIAADVLNFFTNYEAQKARAIENSQLPTIKSLYEDEDVLAASPFFAPLYDVFLNTVARPSTVSAPNYNEVSVAFFQAVYSVLTGEEDAAQSFEELELELQDITGLDTE